MADRALHYVVYQHLTATQKTTGYLYTRMTDPPTARELEACVEKVYEKMWPYPGDAIILFFHKLTETTNA